MIINDPESEYPDFDIDESFPGWTDKDFNHANNYIQAQYEMNFNLLYKHFKEFGFREAISLLKYHFKIFD